MSNCPKCNGSMEFHDPVGLNIKIGKLKQKRVNQSFVCSECGFVELYFKNN